MVLWMSLGSDNPTSCLTKRFRFILTYGSFNNMLWITTRDQALTVSKTAINERVNAMQCISLTDLILLVRNKIVVNTVNTMLKILLSYS